MVLSLHSLRSLCYPVEAFALQTMPPAEEIHAGFWYDSDQHQTVKQNIKLNPTNKTKQRWPGPTQKKDPSQNLQDLPSLNAHRAGCDRTRPDRNQLCPCRAVLRVKPGREVLWATGDQTKTGRNVLGKSTGLALNENRPQTPSNLDVVGRPNLYKVHLGSEGQCTLDLPRGQRALYRTTL